MVNYRDILHRLALGGEVTQEQLAELVALASETRVLDYARGLAREVRTEWYGNRVIVRGLVEISNRCSGGCYYCGLRAENGNVSRYELSEEEILDSCRAGYALGLRSFVLQGGERRNVTDSVARVVGLIKDEMPDVAVTLSLGEQSKQTYEQWRGAGADRYLLRHESATPSHYATLHPERMRWEERVECLRVLGNLGYQRGAGFMVGTPGQSVEMLAHEVKFVRELRPEMVGIGPFIPQSDTPFGGMPRGDVATTLMMLAMVRIALPKALMPATTALATTATNGTLIGVLSGSNVVMPNITPLKYRDSYAIYDGKKSSGTESAEGLERLAEELWSIGYEVTLGRGDHPEFVEKQ